MSMTETAARALEQGHRSFGAGNPPATVPGPTEPVGIIGARSMETLECVHNLLTELEARVHGHKPQPMPDKTDRPYSLGEVARYLDAGLAAAQGRLSALLNSL